MLLNLKESALDGQQAEDRLAACAITVNRNAVPFDPRPPMVTSGVRIGTPAATMRGLDATDFREVGDVIADSLTDDARHRRAARRGSRPSSTAARSTATARSHGKVTR